MLFLIIRRVYRSFITRFTSETDGILSLTVSSHIPSMSRNPISHTTYLIGAIFCTHLIIAHFAPEIFLIKPFQASATLPIFMLEYDAI